MLTSDPQDVATWTLKPDVVARSVGNEMVLLDLESGLYHSLNAVAAVIYERIIAGAPFDELVTAVITEFEVDPDLAGDEVRAFLRAESDAGLLVAS